MFNSSDSPQGGDRIEVVTLDNVTETSVRWIWPGFLPRGKITILDGDPGLGKSTLVLDIAARVSTGRPMPGESPGERGGVLLLSAEDGLGDTIKPRLRAAGADLRLIHHLSSVDDGRGRRPPCLPEDTHLLRQAILEHKITLVVIDPFVAFVSSHTDICSDPHVRRALHRLYELAEETGVAIVLVRHLNKGSSTKAIYRGGGSIGILAAARSALLVAKAPDDPEHRVLAVSKTNLAAAPDSQVFALVPPSLGPADQAEREGRGQEQGPPANACTIAWLGPLAVTADDLVNESAAAGGGRALARAVQFLQQQLVAQGERPVLEVQQAATQAGIGGQALKKARAALGVTSRKLGKHWLIALPQPLAAASPGAYPANRSEPKGPPDVPNPRCWTDILKD